VAAAVRSARNAEHVIARAGQRPLPLLAAAAVGAALAVVVGGFFSWVMTVGFSTAEPFPDYRFHTGVAMSMAAGAPLAVPHPLYHALVAAGARTGLSPAHAGMAVAVLAQVALALIAYADLRRVDEGAAVRPALVAAALTVVAPVYALTPGSREFYFGYLFPNAVHNPTIVLLRPLALALFLAAAFLLTNADARARQRAAAAALTLACALAKPSYLICLLPALAAAWLLDGLPRDRRWTAVALGVIVPGALIVAAQAWFTLTSDRMEPTTIVLAPLKVVFMHTKRNVPLVAMKLLLSILFPLAVVAAFGREAIRDRALRLAWLAFGAGAFYAYFLAETGPRMIDGNFLWSGQAAAAVLFAASARFALARSSDPAAQGRLAACGAVLGLHVACGLFYLVRFGRTAVGF
jgi:hypothetical protein